MSDEYIYVLAEREWQEFLALLERPARDIPKLRQLMSEAPIWEDEN